jgi:hypothetical protein
MGTHAPQNLSLEFVSEEARKYEHELDDFLLRKSRSTNPCDAMRLHVRVQTFFVAECIFQFISRVVATNRDDVDKQLFEVLQASASSADFQGIASDVSSRLVAKNVPDSAVLSLDCHLLEASLTEVRNYVLAVMVQKLHTEKCEFPQPIKYTEYCL